MSQVTQVHDLCFTVALKLLTYQVYDTYSFDHTTLPMVEKE